MKKTDFASFLQGGKGAQTLLAISGERKRKG